MTSSEFIARISKETKQRFEDDIKQQIDPLYDISTLCHKVVLKDLKDLFEATAIVSVKETISAVEELIDKYEFSGDEFSWQDFKRELARMKDEVNA